MVNAGLLCSLVGTGKRMVSNVGWGGICSPFSISAGVAVREGEDRAKGYKWWCVMGSGNCHWKGKRGQVERIIEWLEFKETLKII